MAARVSLAEQIALLSEAAPTDFDPEDLHPPPSDDEAHEAGTSARGHYVDVGPSAMRKANHTLDDPKYKGTRVSRKQLAESDDESMASEEDEDEDDDDEEDAPIPSEDDEDDEPRSLEARPQPQGEFKSVQWPDEASPGEGVASDLASTLRATREQDRKKGKAVARQITLWDTLLDARIRLQRSSTAVNHLTAMSASATASDHPTAVSSLHAMLDEAVALSEDLFSLQESLSHHDGSPAFPPRKRLKVSHDSERDYSEALSSLSGTASAFEASYHPYLLQVLTKWSAKVQAVAPNVLLPANRGSFKNSFAGKTNPPGVVEVIAETLRTDAEKLLARTRSSRTGDDDEDEDASSASRQNVFDDTDFYQQLLRDVIEARGSSLSGEGGEPEWVQRQRARKSKRKKTVDTKASKGRKLRYQVHEKLQNFMVPITVSRGAWHDEQVDELFASLLGKSA